MSLAARLLAFLVMKTLDQFFRFLLPLTDCQVRSRSQIRPPDDRSLPRRHHLVLDHLRPVHDLLEKVCLVRQISPRCCFESVPWQSIFPHTCSELEFRTAGSSHSRRPRGRVLLRHDPRPPSVLLAQHTRALVRQFASDCDKDRLDVACLYAFRVCDFAKKQLHHCLDWSSA